MDKMRTAGLLLLLIIVAAGVMASFSALREWWFVTIGCIFLAFLALAVFMLLSVRSIKWQMVSDRKKSKNETRKIEILLNQLSKQSHDSFSSMASEQKRLEDQHDDSIVVLGASIANLNTRVQQILDTHGNLFRTWESDDKDATRL